MLRREFLFRLAGAAVIVASFIGGWLWMELQTFRDTPLTPVPGVESFIVERGASVRELATTLERVGLIKHAAYFEWLARLQGKAGRVRTGEYAVNAKLTPVELLDNLVNGHVVQHTLTLVEGWTFRQVMDALAANDKLDHTLDGMGDDAIMTRLGLTGQRPEGLFFPDTYYFTRGTSDADFLKRAHAVMNQQLQRAWNERGTGLPYKSPYEALIMASIVEKETGLAEERREIAGVFVRRLQRNMALQTDPTVIYGLGAAYSGNLRSADLRRDSPYNTYKRKGLPPTPIALPGSGSLNAALDPAPGKTLYFVARGDGSHQFSATIEEHNRAVRKYQLKSRSHNYQSRPTAGQRPPVVVR